jgi:hypothetical protein
MNRMLASLILSASLIAACGFMAACSSPAPANTPRENMGHCSYDGECKTYAEDFYCAKVASPSGFERDGICRRF